MLDVEVDTPEAGWLVLPVNWDPGWRASVRGRSTPLLRGNYNQQVVPLAAGRSVVALRYEPLGLRLGLVVSTATGIAGVATVAIERRARRRRGDCVGDEAEVSLPTSS